MNTISQPQIHKRLKINISSFSADKDDLETFCKLLQDKADVAAKIEVTYYEEKAKDNPANTPQEKITEDTKIIKNSFKLGITVSGKDGKEVFDYTGNVFSSVDFPEEVKSLYIDSESILRNIHNYSPSNGFKVFIDFRKPKLFDFSLMPSSETPNESNIEVKGYDSTWVDGTFKPLEEFINTRSSRFSFIHNNCSYDILLMVFCFPISFWICHTLAFHIESISKNTFVTNAMYLYVFLAILMVFRILFHYVRWVFPLVEFKHKNNKTGWHLTLLIGVIGSIIATCIWNFGKIILRIF